MKKLLLFGMSVFACSGLFSATESPAGEPKSRYERGSLATVEWKSDKEAHDDVKARFAVLMEEGKVPSGDDIFYLCTEGCARLYELRTAAGAAWPADTGGDWMGCLNGVLGVVEARIAATSETAEKKLSAEDALAINCLNLGVFFQGEWSDFSEVAADVEKLTILPWGKKVEDLYTHYCFLFKGGNALREDSGKFFAKQCALWNWFNATYIQPPLASFAS